MSTIDKMIPVSITMAKTIFFDQFHVAYSSIIKGIGIWCGMPMLTTLQTTDAPNGASSVSVEQLTQDTM